MALATVLAMEPTILVLDEPSANLDPAARRDLADILGGLTEVTVIVVTHDLLYALEPRPRAVILDDGRIVADGATSALLADADLLAAHRLELPRGVTLTRYAGTNPVAGATLEGRRIDAEPPRRRSHPRSTPPQ